jgi:hypothetical protein
MPLTDLIGFTGVSILLIAYLLQLTNLLSNEGWPYLTLNALGAGVACLASVMLHYWPFIILEGIWSLISLIGLFKYISKTKHL